MSSLLGLASYDSDGSNGDDVASTRRHAAEGSPAEREHSRGTHRSSSSGVVGSASSRSMEECPGSQSGEPLGSEGKNEGDVRGRSLRPSSFDAPSFPTDSSTQVFMPLPSPLVRFDNASPIVISPFLALDPPENASEDRGVRSSLCGGADEGSGGEGGGDVIKPEYRHMLPPEATGEADPALCANIAKLDRMHTDFTKAIKGKKEYGNPAVLAQTCYHCTVDDKGTNYPEDRRVHPSVYDTKDFHDSLMAEERKANRPGRSKRPKSAAVASVAVATVAAGRALSEAAGRAAAREAAPIAAGPDLSAAPTTTKRRSKWGLASDLPVMGQPIMIDSKLAATASAKVTGTASEAVALAAVVAAPVSGATSESVKTGAISGRVGFSAYPADSSARPGQETISLNAQVPAGAGARKEAQQRAEAIARVQMMVNRAGNTAEELPPKKPRLP